MIENIREFHNVDISKLICDLFMVKSPPTCPQFIWKDVLGELKGLKDGTLGLSGKLMFLLGENVTARVPNVFISNILTSPDIYVVQNDLQNDFDIVGIGKDSEVYLGVSDVELSNLGSSRDGYMGIEVQYRRKQKSHVRNVERDYKVGLSGCVDSVFVLNHETKEIRNL